MFFQSGKYKKVLHIGNRHKCIVSLNSEKIYHQFSISQRPYVSLIQWIVLFKSVSNSYIFCFSFATVQQIPTFVQIIHLICPIELFHASRPIHPLTLNDVRLFGYWVHKRALKSTQMKSKRERTQMSLYCAI